MLYLVLFSALALGFYAQTNLGAQVAGNEQRVLVAQISAESGLEFVRYQLSRVLIEPTVARERILEELSGQLGARMEGTGNLGARLVGYTALPAPAINIPAQPNEFIQLESNGAKFRSTITEMGGGRLRVKTIGRAGGDGAATRAIAMEFVEAPVRSPVLNYGVATRGPVYLSKAFIRGSPDAARGSVLSTNLTDSTPVELYGGTAEITGHVYLSHPTGQVSGDGIVAGENNQNWAPYVHPNTAAPEFPSADPAPYEAYLVGRETLITGSTGASYLSNIRVRAGTNPTFSGGGTYEGVILIEAPNHVTFSGGPTIRGVIIVANPAEGSLGNKIDFTGGTTVHGVETLPDTFGALKSMKGAVVLAPNFALDLSGGSTSFGGTILAASMTLSGGSGGTITGNVILTGTSALSMTGGSTITLAAPAAGTPAVPTGLRFTHTYAPYPATYLEVSP